MKSPELRKRENESQGNLVNESWHIDIEVDERQPKRESGFKVPLQSSQGEAQSSSWDVLGRALKSLFDSGRMVRLVGPNDRPLERHEFEGLPYIPQSQWRNKF